MEPGNQSKTKIASNTKITASNTKLPASITKLKASNTKLPTSITKLTASNTKLAFDRSLTRLEKSDGSKPHKSTSKMGKIFETEESDQLLTEKNVKESQIQAAPSQNIEKYLEETIYDYLQSQHDVPEHDFSVAHDVDQIPLEEIRRQQQEDDFMRETIEEVLADILENVENTRLFKNKYQHFEREHPQFTLFDVKDILPDFKMDWEMIRKLSFRETLVISNTDEFGEEGEGIPKAVGALCLHIHFGEGLSIPAPLTDQELDEDVEETVERVKRESRPHWDASRRGSSKTEIIEKKLKNYEEFLEQQMSSEVEKFIVHLSSDFDVDGKSAGSRMVSWVDKKIHTLEERRTEYIGGYNDDENSKKILYFAMQPNNYYVKHMEKVGPEEENEIRKYYPKVTCKDLVGEGANFVLMRYLAITKFVGTFQMSTMYIDGSLCQNDYECTPTYEAVVNNQTAELMKIYRVITEEKGIQHQCLTVLSTYGKIITQEWAGCPYMFHVNPLSLSVAKPMFFDSLAMTKMWESDMELMSKYLDCKTEAELKMKTYLKDHPEVQNLMGDYIQSILLLKPENILPFTQDFFLGFEPYKLPSMSYFEDQEDETDMFY